MAQLCLRKIELLRLGILVEGEVRQVNNYEALKRGNRTLEEKCERLQAQLDRMTKVYNEESRLNYELTLKLSMAKGRECKRNFACEKIAKLFEPLMFLDR
jgi:hypothetical protein